MEAALGVLGNTGIAYQGVGIELTPASAFDLTLERALGFPMELHGNIHKGTYWVMEHEV
jgi:hypothetical protein